LAVPEVGSNNEDSPRRPGSEFERHAVEQDARDRTVAPGTDHHEVDLVGLPASMISSAADLYMDPVVGVAR
jgi:hypothetical protein